MLKSEEMLNRFVNEEKNRSAEPSAVTDAGNNVADVEAEVESQKATVDETKTETTTDGKAVQSASQHEDRFASLKRDFDKRFNRQEKSHRLAREAWEKEKQELLAQIATQKPELKKEDFQSQKDWDEYRENKLVERAKAEFAREQEEKTENEKKQAERRERIDSRLKSNFGTQEAIDNFKEAVGDFYDDEEEFIESDNGLLFQEIVDNSPVGPLMALAIAKSPDAINAIKNYSKDMLYYQLKDLESKILARKNKKPEESNTAAESKPATIPDTGDIGRNTPRSTTFSAKEWLRKNRPEYYK